MNNPLILSLCFGLGVVLQSFFLIEHRLFDKKAIKGIARCLGIALVMALLTYAKIASKIKGVNFYHAIFMFFTYFSIIFALTFAKEILPVISEKTVLIINLLFLYVLINYLPHNSAMSILILAALIPTVLTLLYVLTNIRLSNFFKVSFYLWYLAMIFFIALLQFSFNNLTFFFSKSRIELLNPAEVFLSGATFLYLVIHVSSIVHMIPIPDKHQTFEERMAQVREFAHILEDKFSDYQLKIKYALFIMALQGGILALNYYKQFMPDYIVINISLLIAPQFISKQFTLATYKVRQ